MALHDVFLSHFDKETSFIDVDTHYEIMRWNIVQTQQMISIP